MDLVLIALVVGLIVILVRAQRAQVQPKPDARQQQLADQRWASVRRVAEEDVTQLGEQIADTPVAADLPADGRADFDDALGAYERAKQALAAALPLPFSTDFVRKARSPTWTPRQEAIATSGKPDRDARTLNSSGSRAPRIPAPALSTIF